MNPGRLNQRIAIQKIKTITTVDGFKDRQWKDWWITWASKNNLWGKEFYAAKAINEEKTVEFRMRYFSKINEMNSTEYRVLHDGQVYNITFIDNIRYENKWVVFKTIARS